MKRNILSVLLACLMIVSLCLMVGCKTDDLEAQIIENDAKQEGAVSDAVADLDSSIKSAADTAAANLAEAQKKLEGMIASGDAVDAAALNAAIADFNAALAAAQETLEGALGTAIDSVEGDLATVKADLEQAIKDATDAITAATDKKLAEAKATLETAIANGDAALSTAIDAVTNDLVKVQEILTKAMVEHDNIVKIELTAKYDAVIAKLTAKVEDDLAKAVDALETLIATNATAAADALTAAVDELEAALDNATKAAQLANDTLKAELEAKIAADIKTAGDQLTAYVNTKVADLQAKLDANAADDASVAELNKAVTDLNAAITAAQAAAEAAAATGNEVLKAELQKEIDADVKTAVDALNATINTKVDELKAMLKANADDDASVAELNKAVTDLTALINDAKAIAAKATADLSAELKAEIDADVAKAVTDLTAYIDGKVKDLQDKLDANAAEDVSQAELTAAVDTINAAIEAAKKLADEGNDALKTELNKNITDAVDAAVTALTTYIDGKVKDLQDKLDANANEDVSQAELTAAVDAINAAIEAVEKAAADANDTLKTALENKIAADIKAASDALTAYIDGKVKDLQDKLDANAAEDVSQDELTAAVDTINTAIEAAKKLAADANDALKADLEKKINDDVKAAVDTLTAAIAKAVKDLQGEIDSDVATAVTELKALIAAAEETAAKATADLSAELKKEIDDDVKAAYDKLIAYVDDAITDLSNTTSANLSTEVEKINTAITTLENALKKADEDLKADYEKKIADLKDYVDTMVKAWNDGTEAAVVAIPKLRAAYKSAVITSAALDAYYEEMQIRVMRATKAEIINALVTEFENAVKALKDISDSYATINPALYSATELAKIDATFDYFVGKIIVKNSAVDTLTATFKSAVAVIKSYGEELGVNASTFFTPEQKTALATLFGAYLDKYTADTVDTAAIAADFADVVAVVKSYVAIERVLYYSAQLAEIDAFFNALVPTLTADVDTLISAYTKNIDEVLYKWEFIENIFADLGFTTDKVVYNDAWNKALTDAETLIAKEKADHIDVYNRTEFQAVVTRVAALRERYIVLEGYEAGKALADRLDAILADVAANGIIYDNTTLEGTVATFRADYDAWYAALPTNATIAPELFGTKMTDFAAIEARIAALDKALADATTNSTGKDINNRVDALIIAIDKYTVAAANKTEFEALTALVKAWKEAYFSGDYAAEAVAGNANYDLLDWADWAKVQEDWANAQVRFKEIAGDYFDAVKNLPATIDLFSEDEITDALNAYDKMYGVTEYDNIFNENFGKTAAEIQAELANKYTQYSNLKATALDAYNTAFAPVADYVNGTKVVDIYTRDAFKNLLTWFDTYGCKVGGVLTFTNMKSDGTAITPAGYILSNTLTVTEEDYNKFVELNKLAKDLEAAKLAETAAVQDAIDNVVNAVLGLDKDGNKTADDTSAAIKAVRDAYEAWVAGTGATRPAGTVADQFKYDDTKLDYTVDTTKLVAEESDYATLVSEAAIVTQAFTNLKAFTKSTDFNNDGERDAYNADIIAVLDLRDTFITTNGGDYVWFDMDKVAAGKLAIYRYDAVKAVKAEADATSYEAIVETAEAEVVAQAILAIDSAADNAAVDAAKALAIAKLGALYGDAYGTAYYNVTGVTEYADPALKALADAFAKNKELVLAATAVAELPTNADEAFAAIAKISNTAAGEAAVVAGSLNAYATILANTEKAMLEAYQNILNAIVENRDTAADNDALATTKFADFVTLATDYDASNAQLNTTLGSYTTLATKAIAALDEIYAADLATVKDATAAATLMLDGKATAMDAAAVDFVAADAAVEGYFADPALAEDLAVLKQILADELAATFAEIADAATVALADTAKADCIAFNTDVEDAAAAFIAVYNYVAGKASAMSANSYNVAVAALDRIINEFADTVVSATDRVAVVTLLEERSNAVKNGVTIYAALYATADTDLKKTKLDEQFKLDMEHTLFASTFTDADSFLTVITDNLTRALMEAVAGTP